MEATGLETLLTVVGTVWTQITTLVTTISAAPLLLIGLAGAFASLIISLALKLMGIRRRRR